MKNIVLIILGLVMFGLLVIQTKSVLGQSTYPLLSTACEDKNGQLWGYNDSFSALKSCPKGSRVVSVGGQSTKQLVAFDSAGQRLGIISGESQPTELMAIYIEAQDKFINIGMNGSFGQNQWTAWTGADCTGTAYNNNWFPNNWFVPIGSGKFGIWEESTEVVNLISQLRVDGYCDNTFVQESSGFFKVSVVNPFAKAVSGPLVVKYQ